MPFQSEEERIREVLRDLKKRKEGGDVKEDIERIERILRDPLFKQLSNQDFGKSSQRSAEKRNGTIKSIDEKRLEEFKNRLENSEIRQQLKANQKLHVFSFDAKLVEPLLLETKEKASRLLIVGPKDIKSRSSGKLRIGDCVVAIDATTSAATSTNSNISGEKKKKHQQQQQQQKLNYSSSEIVENDDDDDDDNEDNKGDGCDGDNVIINKSTFESLCRRSIADNNRQVVIGVVREATPMVLSGDWTQVEVIRLSTETGGLGFGIVGGTSTGVVVKTILPGSAADKDGRLQPGDHILQIGNINTHGMSSQQVATILRHQHPTVEMIVGRPIAYADKPADTSECFTLATKAALCATTLEEALQRQMANSAPSTAAIMTPATVSPSASCAPIEEEKDDNDDEKQQPQQRVATPPEMAPTTSSSSSPPLLPPPPDSIAVTVTTTTSTPNVIDLRKPCDCAPSYNRRESLLEPKDSINDQELNMARSPTTDSNMQSESNSGSGSNSSSNGINRNGSSSITSKMSLKSLQEMALTVFLRENWDSTKFEIIDVVLQRDPALGLGITVAGYVHKKEEIGGIFVKSLVPRSAASSSGVIKVHDLILDVNGTSLEHMSHADSVRTLVKSGDQVRLKLVRFPASSSQAQCLKMLQQQETETQVIDVKLSNPDLVKEWKSRIGDDIEIVTAVVKPDRQALDGGLGISLEGTVDVVNGAQLCPHHYIESIRENGPVAKTNALHAGDELLQVNHSPLYGESHVTVRQALTRAVHSGAPVTLIVARRSQKMNVFEPSTYEKQLPLSFPFLAANQEQLVKAKSDVDLTTTRAETTQLLQQVSRRLRSKSLENFHGLAVWNCVPLVIFLNKDSRGLGFSIVDYKDPSHRNESVIVVQSLVPGGVAQADGRIVPGDRLLFVNNHDLSNSSLERAVAVLKAARMGPVRLGIAKPIPADQSQFTSYSPLCSRSERLLARGRSPRGRRRYLSGTTSSQETVWIGTAEQYRKLHPQGYYPSSRSPSTARSERSLCGSEFSMTSWSPCSTRSVSPCGSPISLRGSWAYDVVFLPTHLERTIKIQKGALPLGIVLDGDKDKGVNGCVVKSICGKKAVALDGRIQVGDYVVKINTESLRNVTNSQARATLKRTNLVGTFCNVTYITSADAKTWKERFQKPSETTTPIINRLSPKVFPKFYRSPYVSGHDDTTTKLDTDDETEATEAPSIMSDSMSEAIKLKTLETIDDDHPTTTEAVVIDFEANRKRLNRLIDGTEIDEFVGILIKEAITDASIELAALTVTKDWSIKNVHEKSAEKSEEDVEAGLSATDSVVFRSTIASTTTTTPRTSQLHILSTEEEVEHQTDTATATTIDATSAAVVPPPISPGAIRLEEEDNEKAKTCNVQQLAKAAENESITVEEVEVTSSGQPPTQSSSIPSPPIPPPQPSLISSQQQQQQQQQQQTQSSSNMSRVVTSRTPSTGSESLQHQARQLARSKYWGEARTVTLIREPNKSFGISIVGGRVEVSQKGGLPGTGNTVCGIFIKSVLPNSPAGRSGQMNMGDRVISVNDVDLKDATHEQAVNAIKNSTNPVRFVLQSLHTNTQNMINSASNSTVGSVRFENPNGGEAMTSSSTTQPVQIIPLKPMMKRATVEKSESKENEQDEVVQRESLMKRKSIEKQTSTESKKSNQSVKKGGALVKKSSSKETAPLIVSDVSSSETHDDLEQPNPTLTPSTSACIDDPKLLENLGIEKESAAFMARNDGEAVSNFYYTKSKIERKYGADNDEQVVFVSCERPEAGLGISLAGNKDREKQSVFVVNVKPACPLAIRVGDELLEINGRVLSGISHVTASTIVRECCDQHQRIEIVLKRNDGSLNQCAVRTNSLTTSSSPPLEEQNQEQEHKKKLEESLTPPTLSTLSLSQPTHYQISNPKEESIEMPPTTTDNIENTIPNAEATRKKSFSVERTAPIDNGRETMIEIDKDGKGLGLSIVGGADTVLGTVVIHEVYPDGAAAHDGRLKPGDQVLEVNGISLRGVSHDQSIAYLRRTPPKVRLLIYRDVNLQLSLLDPTQIYNMFEIDLQKKTGRGLGISIVGRKNEPGVYVSEIVKGGVAESDGRLMPGDQILEVNGKDVSGCMQEDVAAMLKMCTGKVHLKLGRWKITETANRVHAATEALAKSATTPRTSENNTDLMNANNTTATVAPTSSSTLPRVADERKDVPPPAPPMRPIITHTSPDGCETQDQQGLSPVTEEPSSGTDFRSALDEEKTPLLSSPSPTTTGATTNISSSSSSNNNNSLAIDIIHDLKEDGSDTLLVELKKVADQQLGMGIGKRTRGILVTSLQPGSTAAEKLKVGDRIMAVNALPVTDQLSAVTFVKASGDRLFLQIARPRTFPPS